MLAILYRMREEVGVNPEFFDMDAQARIEKTIALFSPKENFPHCLATGKVSEC